MHYILDGHTPKPCDLMTWARWFETAERHVAKTDVGPYWVSTVFLGTDHRWGEGPPLLFETMVFWKKSSAYPTRANGAVDDFGQERYSTWDEAEAGHALMVETVRKSAAG